MSGLWLCHQCSCSLDFKLSCKKSHGTENLKQLGLRILSVNQLYFLHGLKVVNILATITVHFLCRDQINIVCRTYRVDI